jgi:hypothetical protein
LIRCPNDIRGFGAAGPAVTHHQDHREDHQPGAPQAVLRAADGDPAAEPELRRIQDAADATGDHQVAGLAADALARLAPTVSR